MLIEQPGQLRCIPIKEKGKDNPAYMLGEDVIPETSQGSQFLRIIQAPPGEEGGLRVYGFE